MDFPWTTDNKIKDLFYKEQTKLSIPILAIGTSSYTALHQHEKYYAWIN